MHYFCLNIACKPSLNLPLQSCIITIIEKVQTRRDNSAGFSFPNNLKEAYKMASYYQSGYEPPAGIKSASDVKRKQKELGVEADGIWGTKTQAAYDKQNNARQSANPTSSYSAPKGIDSVDEIKQVQKRLGVTADGIWGKNTQTAWDNMRGGSNLSVNQSAAYTKSNRSQYTAPQGIDSMDEIKQVQKRLGVTADGIWGKDTQTAWDAMRSGGNQPRYSAPDGIDNKTEIKQVQKRLGVTESGIWDKNTNDAWETMRTGGKISASKYTAKGFAAPEGVDSPTDVRNIQKVLGVKQSGIWDMTTQSAWNKQFGDLWTPNQNNKHESPQGIDNAEEIKQVQSRLGVTIDGTWNEETQNAWERMRGANTAATFTKEIINKGKSVDHAQNDEALTLYRQEKSQKNREYIDWQIKKASTAKKAGVFLQRDMYNKRLAEDNKGMEAMADLYNLLIAREENKDAQNILAHMKEYNDKAIDIKNKPEENEYNVGKSGHRYDANDARLQLARDLGLTGHDKMPAFENGNVVVDVYKGPPLFGFNDMQKNNLQKLSEKIIGYVISAQLGSNPYTIPIEILLSAGREFQIEDYLESFPGFILQEGDVVVYYSSNEAGINGSEYAFRNGELLYEDHRLSGGETILGENYMKYASELKTETDEVTVSKFIVKQFASYLFGKTKDDIIKNIKKALKQGGKFE